MQRDLKGFIFSVRYRYNIKYADGPVLIANSRKNARIHRQGIKELQENRIHSRHNERRPKV